MRTVSAEGISFSPSAFSSIAQITRDPENFQPMLDENVKSEAHLHKENDRKARENGKGHGDLHTEGKKWPSLSKHDNPSICMLLAVSFRAVWNLGLTGCLFFSPAGVSSSEPHSGL